MAIKQIVYILTTLDIYGNSQIPSADLRFAFESSIVTGRSRGKSGQSAMMAGGVPTNAI
jgi:hypothetical protein